MDYKASKLFSSQNRWSETTGIKRRVPELRCTKRKGPEGGKKKLKCHFCRHKKGATGIVSCLNYSMCHHAFCYDCIGRHFRNKEMRRQPKILPDHWVCFTCRGLCHCERCKLNLVKELSVLNKQISESSDDAYVLDDKGNSLKTI